MTARRHALAHRSGILIAAAAATSAVLLWMAIAMLQPLPPRSVTMATGPEGGAYQRFGKRYREILAREGVDLRLKPTEGARENRMLLRDPRSGVSVAFLQGGTTSEEDSPDLESLGTVFHEPLWLFYRRELRGKGLDGLRGRRLSIGTEGSGTRALSLELLARNRIDQGVAEWLSLTPQEAAEKLIRGEIDAAVMIAAWEAPLLQRLLAAGDVELASFPRADAYVALYPYLTRVVVPAGAAHLATNQPPTDTVLLAPLASLAVRADLHPAIQYLLLDAAEQVHSGPGIFQKAGQFPAAESIDLPLSDEARQFYRSGRPFLQRQLPFWLAVLIGRLLVVLIPVIGLLYPLFRGVPSLYRWSMERRIHRLYGELRVIEHGIETRDPGQGTRDLVEQLDRLHDKARRLPVTVSCVGMLYLLKDHIAQVRRRAGNPDG